MRVIFAILSVALAVAALYVLSRDLLPPRQVSFAVGPEGGGYWRIAERYRTVLARDGISVELIPTEGSVANARIMAEGNADIAILQGGVPGDGGIEAIAALFMEPIFFFHRRDNEIPSNPADWKGLTMTSGGNGSGTQAAVQSFHDAAGLAWNVNRHLPLGGKEAAETLLNGEADLAIFVAPVAAPYLDPLFGNREIGFARIDYIEALSRRINQSTIVEIPAGSISLAPLVPETDTRMLAMVARLVAQSDLHPALVDRLVEAASEIHSARDAITREGQFPSMRNISLPVDPYARSMISSGPSPLHAYLPYWVVAQINRFVVLLLPVLFLLIPVMRMLPGIYAWRMKSRVYRHYNDIRSIDAELNDGLSAERLRELDRKLTEIDAGIARLKLPLPYRDYAYTARLHVELVRKRIADLRPGLPPA